MSGVTTTDADATLNWYTASIALRPAAGSNWTCTFSSDTFTTGQTMAAGTATTSLYLENNVNTIGFRAAANVAGATGQTSAVISKPTGTATDDVLIANLYLEQNTPYSTITAPSGWTALTEVDNTAAAPDIRHLSYWKRATASEPANYTWSWTPSLWRSGAISAFSGVVNTGSPIDVEGGGQSGTSASPQALSVTTSTANTMLYAMFLFFNSAVVWTDAAGMSTAVKADVILDDYAIQAAAGASGAKTAGANSADDWVAKMIALKPAARTCNLTVTLKQNAASIGSATVSITSPAAVTLVTTLFSTSAVTFATGDRLNLDLVAPNDGTNCNARLSFDGTSTQSKVVTATIVPEGLLGLLFLAPALPWISKRWKRWRGR